MRIQIALPCYNEGGRFSPETLDRYLEAHADVGFILVNDGSTDDTLGILRAVERSWPDRVEVIDQQPNQGKAEAVRVGMLRGLEKAAHYVGYFDADLATPLESIADFVNMLDQHPSLDIVIGARVALLGRSIKRSARRHYVGRVFATAASLVLGAALYDTQCGAKLFRASPAIGDLLSKPFGSRWIFDVELLARYLGRNSKNGIYELPLQHWSDVGESHLKLFDFVRATWQLSTIYKQHGLSRDLSLLIEALRQGPKG